METKSQGRMAGTSIYAIALTSFILFLSTQVGVPVLPHLSAQLGADQAAMAATLSAALMTLVLFQFFSGALADRYGRRTVLVGGAALGGLSSLCCAVVGSWQGLLALRILGGVADAIALPALLGLTAEISAGRHGTFFGVLRSSQGLSFIVAPAIGGWLSLYGLRMPFVIDAILSFLACLVLYASVRAGPVASVTGRWQQLGELFRQRWVYAFALFGAVDNFAFPILASFLPTKAQSLGFAPWQISLILVGEATAFTAGSLLVGRCSDRWGRRPFVILAQLLVMLSCVGLALSNSLVAMVGWYTLFGLGASATFLLSSVMMADITPPESAATALGAFDAAIDLVIFAGPATALTLYHVMGRIEPLFIVAALPALAALPVAWRTRETLCLDAVGIS